MYLNKIIENIRRRVDGAKQEMPLNEVIGKIKSEADIKRSQSFYEAITKPGIGLIAEAKKASPSAGTLRNNYNITELVRVYEENGAVAVSVLTEPTCFMGDKSHVEIAARNCGLPILQKDFFIDKYQIYEARALGANAILLIAAILNDIQIKEFIAISNSLNLDAIIEVHTIEELKRVLAINPKIIGINNRDLKDFSVDLNTSIELGIIAKKKGAAVIAESGIKRRDDVLQLESAGFDAMLVGSQIVSASDPGKAIKELLGRKLD